jgi:hypothetical protein
MASRHTSINEKENTRNMRGIQPPRLPKQLHADALASIEDRAEYAALSISGNDLTRQAASGVSS